MLEFLIVLALILLNGFFSMSEMSLMTSRKSRLKQMANTSKRAANALKLSEKPENFLSTVQIGITLIGILTGLLGGEAIGLSIGQWLHELIPSLGSYAAIIGKVLAVTLITFLTLIFGELVPKRLAITKPETIASQIATPMDWLARLTAPIVALLSMTTRGVLRLLGLGKEEAANITEEEIRMLVSESHEQGLIDEHERDMMNRVMRLGDRNAESLMTPRNRIAWLDTNASLEDNLETIKEHQFSRYPVYQKNDQNVVGILEIKSLLDRFGNSERDIFHKLRDPIYVSESTHPIKLLEILRSDQGSMALVVDEYGDIQGLVTVNDLMAAVVGRLQFVENLDQGSPVTQREDGSLLVDGSLSITDLHEFIGEAQNLFPEKDADYHTLAGLCIYHFGSIPKVGEYFNWGGWRIEIVDLDGARIDKLLLIKLSEKENNVT